MLIRTLEELRLYNTSHALDDLEPLMGIIDNVEKDMQISATYQGVTYTYNINVKATDYGYYDILTTERGYSLVTSSDELSLLAEDNYFIIASETSINLNKETGEKQVQFMDNYSPPFRIDNKNADENGKNSGSVVELNLG